jgi:ElaA protein
MTLRWQWCRLTDLSAPELYAIFAARQAVFVVEQTCPYPDLDGYDLEAEHLIAWSGAEVAAYLRLISPGVKYEEPSLGRILTTALARGTGAGRELLARGLERTDQLYPKLSVRIGAQSRLEKFYGSFGFVTVSEPYDEDGIVHVEMVRAPLNRLAQT